MTVLEIISRRIPAEEITKQRRRRLAAIYRIKHFGKLPDTAVFAQILVKLAVKEPRMAEEMRILEFGEESFKKFNCIRD